jgi:glycosyltransferase involved in cell wall biosynthesis
MSERAVTPGRPTVSVIIPARDRAKVIGRAIASVLAQTFQDFELIVVDDASRDGLAATITSFHDDRITLARLDSHGGAARARNAGITESRGEWIAFLDSDDEWLPDKLERQLTATGRSGASYDAVYSACYRQRDGESPEVRPKGELPEGNLLDNLLRNKKGATASVYMVRRTALVRAKGFDERFPSANDIDLWLRLASMSCRFAAVQEPLVIKHDSGMDQIKQDAIAKAIGFRRMDKRWGPVMKERLGEEAYRRWYGRRLRTITQRQEEEFARFVSSGSRGDALRYAQHMTPLLPWSRHYVARALSFALAGRSLYDRFAAAAPRTTTLITRE